jgi:hypothetical protein
MGGFMDPRIYLAGIPEGALVNNDSFAGRILDGVVLHPAGYGGGALDSLSRQLGPGPNVPAIQYSPAVRSNPVFTLR